MCGIATDITERKRTQDALTSAALAVSSAQGATRLPGAGALSRDDPRSRRGPDRHALRREAAGHACGSTRSFSTARSARTSNTRWPAPRARRSWASASASFASGLRERFPGDLDLQRFGLESYAGFPLTDTNGAPLGLISVMSRRPMANAEFIESILKIFAVRAAAELERQRSEEVLRRSEASYRAIFESSEDAIFIHDWDTGRVIDVNRRACEIYGYSYEEMKRHRRGEAQLRRAPVHGRGGAARVAGSEERARPVRFEWHRRNRDGSLHWDEVVLRTGDHRGRAPDPRFHARDHRAQAGRAGAAPGPEDGSAGPL